MANFVYIATSIDGYIAKEDGNIDWLHETPNPTQSDFGFSDFMEKIDFLVMGRSTYEKVLSFAPWPYEKKVYVLSNTLKVVPESLTGKVEFVKGSPKEILAQLNKNGSKNLYIDGGKTIQSFLRKGLIDELIITRIPIILGGGIPLFSKLQKPLKLEHCSTKTYGGGLVKSHYKKHPTLSQ